MVSWDGARADPGHVDARTASPARAGAPTARYLVVRLVASGREGRAGVAARTAPAARRSRLTDVKGGVSDYAWSPDGKRLVARRRRSGPARSAGRRRDDEGDRQDAASRSSIDRYHFKADVDGYLRGERTHLYLFDVATKKAETLTAGRFDEDIAGVVAGRQADRVRPPARRRRRRQGAEPRRVRRSRRGPAPQPRRLTTTPADETGPLSWSPDGKSIAYLRRRRAEVLRLQPEPAGGRFRRPAASRVCSPSRSTGRSRRRSGRPTAVDHVRRRRRSRAVPRRACRSSGGAVETARRRPPRRHGSLSAGADGAIAVLASTPTELPEVYALENGALRQLTHQNDEWLHGAAARHDRGVHLDEQGRHRGPRADRQAGRRSAPGGSIRRCCASTAARTGRTSTRSTSSASSSPPTATSWSP